MIGGDSDERTRVRLGVELEAALVRALLRDWETLNYTHFRNALRPPVLRLGDAEGRLGQWSPEDRSIEIGRRLALEHPWGVVKEVLKHEMAHQYAHEVLHASDERAHGEAFHRGCALLGIDPAATGLPRGEGALGDEEARVLGRIAKLLALAGSPERHEAEAAMREAQRLMLKHNVAAATTGRAARYGFRHLGEPTGRMQVHQRILASLLGTHFFVETIWVPVYRPREGKSATVLEVCGSDANLEMAAYVHDFLLRTSERLWHEHKRRSGVRSDRERRSYLAGVIRGFHQKLDEQRKETRSEGLVWLADAGLSRFFDARYPRRRTSHSSARAHPGAFAEGQRAGQGIVLHRPVASGAAAGGPRLLPPRRAGPSG